MKKLISYLLQGLLYLAPISITIYAIYALFSFVDGLLSEFLTHFIGERIPGLGALSVAVLLVLIGYVGQTVIAKPFKYLFRHLMERIPLLKLIFTSINDLFSAFVGKERKFNKPVLVKLSHTNELEKLGFITDEDLNSLGEPDKIAVYFPHSYNFSGELFIVPKANVKPIDIPPADVMKFIVSAGVADWDNYPKPE